MAAKPISQLTAVERITLINAAPAIFSKAKGVALEHDRISSSFREFFWTNGVSSEEDKRAILLVKLNWSGYSGALHFLTNGKLNTTSSDDIIRLLTSFYGLDALANTAATERSYFEERLQRMNESEEQYIAALIQIAARCSFGSPGMVDMVLKRFMTGRVGVYDPENDKLNATSWKDYIKAQAKLAGVF